MAHEVDIHAFAVHTDLALEYTKDYLEDTSIVKKEYKVKDMMVTNIFLPYEIAEKINKKHGNYTTIEFKDITDYKNRENLKHVFAKELENVFKTTGISKTDSCLVVGIGNDKSTPDSLGPETIKNIIVTNHLFEASDVEKGFRKTFAFSPGVIGTTGIEASDLVKSTINTIFPDFIIVIDALSSESIDRINKVIQITDTGISPGSGVGHGRKEVSRELYNIPVIAIGIPTVIDVSTIVNDTINYMNNDVKITQKMIQNILLNKKLDMMVTSKDIDFLVSHFADVIGNGINIALHRNVS